MTIWPRTITTSKSSTSMAGGGGGAGYQRVEGLAGLHALIADALGELAGGSRQRTRPRKPLLRQLQRWGALVEPVSPRSETAPPHCGSLKPWDWTSTLLPVVTTSYRGLSPPGDRHAVRAARSPPVQG